MCLHAKSLQLCPTLCDTMDCILPSSSVWWILQAGILESVAMPSSRGSSWPRDQIHISCLLHLQAGSLSLAPPGKPKFLSYTTIKSKSIMERAEFNLISACFRAFPGGSDGQESACNVGDLGLLPWLGKSSGEGNGTHSSILAWRISWTIQSIGSQRVGYDWATNTFTFTLLLGHLPLGWRQVGRTISPGLGVWRYS